jgi:site-specific DNA-methyltransferase (adenine-specific)
MNTLYYGDNLKVLREHIKDESVDLIYLDPPFNSNRSYNVLFKDESGISSDAQITAFDDAWHWGETAERTYQDLIQNAPMNVAQMMGSLRQFIGANQMLAYLVMMAARLVELRRVLKPTGSLYLHCDPTASHYLKILLDMIFGLENFRNEIIWKRSHPKGQAFTRFARNHDVILAYSKKIELSVWNSQYIGEITEKTLQQYSLIDEKGRRYQLTSLLNPNPDRPNLTYSFKGKLKVWRWTKERMLEADRKGDIVVPRNGEGIPRYKRYLDEQEGIPIDDTWIDIEPASGDERLGYPTQKPLSLLERIIQASSNPGDVVLDPFSGCGTCIDAAQSLGRQWIGIDITHLAIAMHKSRLKDRFGFEPKRDYAVVGEPEDLSGAQQLAHDDRYQFQWWALSLIQARPLGGDGGKTGKKGSDRGVDGAINFLEERGVVKRALVQVKSGHVKSGDIRDLKGTLEREGAQIGVFLTLEPASREMVTEAASAGFYHSDLWHKDYPRIQLLSVEELLNGVEVRIPPTPSGSEAFKKAERAAKDGGHKQGELGI